MAINIDDRFFDFAGVEFVHATDLVQNFGDLPRCVAVEIAVLLLIDQIPQFLAHLIFHRRDVTIEHVLEILVEIIVQLGLDAAHHIQLFQNLRRKLGVNVVEDLVHLLVDQELGLFVLVPVVPVQAIPGPDCARFFRVDDIRAMRHAVACHSLAPRLVADRPQAGDNAARRPKRNKRGLPIALGKAFNSPKFSLYLINFPAIVNPNFV